MAICRVQPDGKDLKVDINVNRGGGGPMVRQSALDAIGGLAVSCFILIVMAVRGGRERRSSKNSCAVQSARFSGSSHPESLVSTCCSRV